MKVELTGARQSWIAREIAAGRLTSADEAVDRALALYQRHLEGLRLALDPAIAALDRGDGIEEDADAFKRRMREYHPQLTDDAARR